MTPVRRRDRLREAVTADPGAQRLAAIGLQYLALAKALVAEGLPAVRRAVFDNVAQVAAEEGPVSCGPACAACCHGPIPVTQLEVERLQQAATPEVRERAVAMAALDDDDPALRSTPCPALHPRLRTCTIYDERPLVCRSHVSWGPRASCLPGGPGAVMPPNLAAFVLATMHATELEHGAPLILHDVLAVAPDGR